MRLMFLGDVVGKVGREAVYERLPILREQVKPDIVVVNGENAAHGFGITEDIYNSAITLLISAKHWCSSSVRNA
jgi:2',3'-cyclic-nucleotide 2'-phosphodiesterase